MVFLLFWNSALNTTLPEKLYAAFQNEIPKGWNVTEFLSGWVTQPGYPVLNVNVSSDRKSVVISQRKFLRNAPEHQDNTLWNIPISFASNKQNVNFNETNAMVHLSNVSLRIDLGKDAVEWILFNVQQTGKYVRHNSIDFLNLLRHYLNGT